MTTPDLLPCPFCGGRAIWCGDQPDDKHECHRIMCTECGLDADFRCSNELETMPAIRDEMRMAWNRRAIKGEA